MKQNVLKVLCLAVGLTLGLVLLAKVCFIEAYNSCIPHKERVCQLQEHFRKIGDPDFREADRVSGGVAPTLAAEIPEVESATRITMFTGEKSKLVTEDLQRIPASIYFADTSFFDVFRLPVLMGNPKEILAKSSYTMVSRSLAMKLGGMEKVEGMVVTPSDHPTFRLIIAGVFEDIPENCSLHFDALTSAVPLGEWSLNNWLGNDRYFGFIRLREGASLDVVGQKIAEVSTAHVDQEALQAAGLDYGHSATTLDDILASDRSMMNMKRLMLFLGLALIIIAVLNYLVIVVSTLVNRTKEVAVYKCYGASFCQILRMTFRESLMHMLLALAIGALLVFSIKETTETLLAASMSSLFTARTVSILGAICLLLLLVTTLVPGYIFSRVPVAAAFRTQRESKRTWKLGLLFFQFAATAVVVCLLVCITRQYQRIAHADRGFSYDRLLVIRTSNLSRDTCRNLMADIGKIPGVEMVSCCAQLPFGASGNNVYLPGEKEELFNVADMYSIGDNYFDVWEIPVIEGKPFDSKGANERNMMVNREFVEQMREVGKLDATSSVVGQKVVVTEHSNDSDDSFTITGVFENFRLGDAKDLTLRPMVMFYDCENGLLAADEILVKAASITPECTQRINEYLEKALPNAELVAEPFYLYIAQRLNDEKNIRDSLIICALVALIIALVGLVGYTTDEVNRRRKEIAIRRVMGTSSQIVLRILSRDVTLIALPALTVGAAIAFHLVEDWLTDYSERITLDVFTFLLPTTFIYLLILCCVLLRSCRVASESPAAGLRSE